MKKTHKQNIRGTICEGQHYVYTLVDPRDNVPRYVGVTNQPIVRYGIHIAAQKSQAFAEWWSDVLRSGNEVVMHLIMECDEDARYKMEEHLIGTLIAEGHDLFNVKHGTKEPVSRHYYVDGYEKDEHTLVTVKVDADLYTAVRLRSKETGVSVSHVIREALEEWVETGTPRSEVPYKLAFVKDVLYGFTKPKT